MKPYRFWLLLIAGLIVVLFMFGRLVRVRAADEAEWFASKRAIYIMGGGFVTNPATAILSETNYFQTNVTSGDNASGCEMFNPAFGYNLNHNILNHTCTPRVPATERWWYTNIVQISKLKLIWRGEPETIVRIKNVTNVTVRSKLKQEWSEPEADYESNRLSSLLEGVRQKMLNESYYTTNGVYSNLWIDGHMVKVITNTWGGITIEGLPQNKGK